MTAADAAEVVHNFTLVHDDVMDADLLRRHRPMAWTVCGDADAILTGDAMQVLAAKILAQTFTPAATAATARPADCTLEPCEGQSADCAFDKRACDPGRVPGCGRGEDRVAAGLRLRARRPL
jgi:geranylgeranyl diphosphate synthase type I